ncbi:hypothetical protein [Fusobacterium russii]|uniref:hypothetical protein n=1 Tax=Fusobacterium russii TaxID=854 RepID=UPI00039AC157|nr:hypothetical protein [Fusobacterium russii]
MLKDINYVVIARQLENGRFLLTFPDFEGVSTTAETEESISSVASGTIKTKLSELKKAGLEIPEPLKMKDVSSNLNKGEFTTFVSITNFNLDFKSLSNIANKDELKGGAKEIGNKIDKLIKEDVKNVVPSGKENLLLIVAGVISIINTLFFGILSISLPFFGKISIGFFKGVSEFSSYAKELKTASIALMFSGILLLVMAVAMIYFGLVKKMDYIKYIIFSKIGFLLIFYIYLFIKIPSEAKAYISISFFKIFLYLISITLAYAGSVLLTKENEKEY